MNPSSREQNMIAMHANFPSTRFKETGNVAQHIAAQSKNGATMEGSSRAVVSIEYSDVLIFAHNPDSPILPNVPDRIGVPSRSRPFSRLREGGVIAG